MIDVDIDYRNFQTDLAKFAKRLELDIVTVVKKVALDVFTGVVLKTPVDSGIARASWVIGIGSRPSGVSDTGFAKSKGEAVTSEESDELNKLSGVSSDDTVFITNNLAYIERLENGYSDQAPSGMVALTLAEVRSQLT